MASTVIAGQRALMAAPAPRASLMPVALGRHLNLLLDAMRSSALPATSMLGMMGAYHMGWSDPGGTPTPAPMGKSLRGCLALWTADQVAGDARPALAVATAVEWLHNFTLIHDDIQDGDHERRHRPTVWAVYGKAQAINAGDGLHSLALLALLSGPGRAERRLRAAAALNRAVLAVIEGQCLDLRLEGHLDASVKAYERMARAKTGAMIGGAMEAAALASGAGVARAALLRRAGIELGLAFQVRDDWLGTWGDSALTGKGRGDIGRRKLTYPVVLALQELKGAARRELRRLYSSRGGDEERIRTLLDESRVSTTMTDSLLRHSSNALDMVAAARFDRHGVADFEDIVAYVVERSG